MIAENVLRLLTKIPEAPSANALKTSVPRRTPPSKNTGTRPCAAFTTWSYGETLHSYISLFCVLIVGTGISIQYEAF